MAGAFDQRIVRVGIEIDGQTEVYDQVMIQARGTKYRSAIMGSCDVKIFNLTREHQQYILTKASPIRRKDLKPINISLDIGRESYGTFRLFDGAVFQGGVTQPPDIGITLNSLTNNFQLSKTTVTSFSEWATVEQISQKIAKDLGLSLQLLTQYPQKKIGNFSFTGSPQKQIQKLNEMGIIAYVDNKVLIVCDPQQARNTRVTLINAETGMVGQPQPTATGCSVRVMATQSIDVGCEVLIRSDQNPAVNGFYIVMQLDYEVSNRADPFWYTLDCLNKDFFTGTT